LKESIGGAAVRAGASLPIARAGGHHRPASTTPRPAARVQSR